MTIEDRFFAYASAFEESYEDDDWERLTDFFTEHAVYDSGYGEPAHGREAVLAKLRGAVSGLDRLMDSRELSVGSVAVEDDTVSISWTASYTRAGLPDLEIAGAEHARFEGERIAHLHDELSAETVEKWISWMAAHGDKLNA